MFRAVVVVLCILVPSALRAEWSVFQPVVRPSPPVVQDPQWSEPLDAYVFAQLNKFGLTPAPAADRREWIRRVTYDLIGLPPAPEEVEALMHDNRTDAAAFADVVDRLLASPRYGERWARHWLDVVRYADSDGFAIDEERPTMWRYRDYVVRVLNEDRPFDQFMREQIAGDELDAGEGGKVALSFFRLGPWEADNMTAEHRRQDYLNDVTTNFGAAFLGLSVGCARCHDHKYDPITQADFYRLQAFFTPLHRETLAASFLPGEMNEPLQTRHEQIVNQRLAKDKERDEFRGTLRMKLAIARGVGPEVIGDADLDQAIKEKAEPITEEDVRKLEALQKEASDQQVEQRYHEKVVAVRNPKEGEAVPEAFVLNNGDVFDPGEKVAPGFLSGLPPWSCELAESAERAGDWASGRRKILAEWLTSSHNPITPRVLVNRLWLHHFGAGLVSTPNDLGANGSGPSHPLLLDYLATRLRESEWRLKPLHREIVLSRAYRTSTRHPESDTCSSIDPDNRLLWRAHFRRLEAETIRDAVLAVSGRLNLEMGGPGFYEALPDGMQKKYSFFSWEPSSVEQRCRRSIYMFQRRNLIHPWMESFDGADLNQSCERRRASVTAPQALALFNGEFTYENSLYLAARLCEQSADAAGRIERLFSLALSRLPHDEERAACLSFLERKANKYRNEAEAAPSDGEATNPEITALRDLSLAIFNTNEFVYLD